jgi:uncharacterized membrane protein
MLSTKLINRWKQQPAPIPKWAFYLLVSLASVGFLDATYLTAEHYFGTGGLQCGLLSGCDVVTTSIYSQIAGIPIALLGAVFYLFIILLLVAAREMGAPVLIRLAFLVVALAFIFTGWLIFLQAFVIGAFCTYCLLSATITIILFGLLTWLAFRTEDERMLK